MTKQVLLKQKDIPAQPPANSCLLSYLQHCNKRHEVDSLQPVLIQVWGEREPWEVCTSFLFTLHEFKDCKRHVWQFFYFLNSHYCPNKGFLNFMLLLEMQPNLWLTLWGAIRSGHDYNAVLEQILKKLLENHGIGNISDLKCVTHTSNLRNVSQRYKHGHMTNTKIHRCCQTSLHVSITREIPPQLKITWNSSKQRRLASSLISSATGAMGS